MIKVGLKYRKFFSKGDIYEVMKVDGSISYIRNNSFPDPKEDRYKWVSTSGLSARIKEKQYSVVSQKTCMKTRGEHKKIAYIYGTTKNKIMDGDKEEDFNWEEENVEEYNWMDDNWEQEYE